jgi:hypothetical protein
MRCGYCLLLKGLVTMQMRLSGVSGLRIRASCRRPRVGFLSWPERSVGVLRPNPLKTNKIQAAFLLPFGKIYCAKRRQGTRNGS